MANIEKSQWDSIFGKINEDLRGDFIGFTWDGMSMSRLGIVRTSGGNRYDENILPMMQDKTAQISGMDGTYFFNSFYTQKPFSLSFAFDGLTEKGLRQLRQLFGDKGIHRLSFDEWPYKEYMVKVSGAPQLKYIPFDDEKEDNSNVIKYEQENLPASEQDRANWNNPLYIPQTTTVTNRIYKGEGILTLVAYNPYARSRAKSIELLRALEEKEDVYLTYESQWAAANVMNLTLGDYDVESNNQIKVYNPGDKETDFMLTITPSLKTPIQLYLYEIAQGSTQNETSDAYLVFTIPSLKEGDEKIRINSKTELIEGLDADGKITGNLYNECIGYGWFFKIPPNKEGFYYIIQTVEADVFTQTNKLSIEYDYWYF